MSFLTSGPWGGGQKKETDIIFEVHRMPVTVVDVASFDSNTCKSSKMGIRNLVHKGGNRLRD